MMDRGSCRGLPVSSGSCATSNGSRLACRPPDRRSPPRRDDVGLLRAARDAFADCGRKDARRWALAAWSTAACVVVRALRWSARRRRAGDGGESRWVVRVDAGDPSAGPLPGEYSWWGGTCADCLALREPVWRPGDRGEWRAVDSIVPSLRDTSWRRLCTRNRKSWVSAGCGVQRVW